MPRRSPSRAKRADAHGPTERNCPRPTNSEKTLLVPWEDATVRKYGNDMPVRYKRLARAKWRPAGEKRIVQIIALAPLRYRKRKGGPVRYTKPAYLIGADPAIAPKEVIQAYLWRWDIEVHFKEEKQLFGLAHAQVRNPQSVRYAPALAIAAYAALHVAALRAFGFQTPPPAVEPPKWRRGKMPTRTSTQDLRRQLRYEAQVNFIDFSGFSFESASS